jgi:hypothetical protein
MLDLVNTLMEIDSLASRVEAGESSGDYNPLTALYTVRMLSKALKKAEEVIEPKAQEYAASYPKSFEHGNVRWTKKEGSRKHSFDNNPVIRALMMELETEKSKSISAADYIGNTLEPKMVDGKLVLPSGEMVVPAQVSYTKSSLTIERV